MYVHYQKQAYEYCVPPAVIPLKGQNVNFAIFQPRMHKQKHQINAIWGCCNFFIRGTILFLGKKSQHHKTQRKAVEMFQIQGQLNASLTLDLMLYKSGECGQCYKRHY